MSNTSQIEKNITKIKETFESFDIKGPKSQILESLRHFELNTAKYKDTGPLSAVIKWHKSQFLQKTSYFPRAEQLLDEALELIENSTQPIFQHWILKIYISLGYVHLAQLNYLDSDSYLKDALNMALSESTQSIFLGEIYPLLSTVNLRLGRHSQGTRRRYVAGEHVKGACEPRPAALSPGCRGTPLRRRAPASPRRSGG